MLNLINKKSQVQIKRELAKKEKDLEKLTSTIEELKQMIQGASSIVFVKKARKPRTKKVKET